MIPPRTTTDLVIGILGGNYGPDANGVLPDLDPFIASASMIVDRVSTMAAQSVFRGGIGLSAVELELIERWVSAHLYSHQDQLYLSKTTAGASGAFQVGTLSSGFESTQYGMTAMTLDYSGSLRKLNGSTNNQKRITAFGGKRRCGNGFPWIGPYGPVNDVPFED